jgi:hypothetical protein
VVGIALGAGSASRPDPLSGVYDMVDGSHTRPQRHRSTNLTRWRMILAADRLVTSELRISTIAPAICYGSERAFGAAPSGEASHGNTLQAFRTRSQPANLTCLTQMAACSARLGRANALKRA